uniref:CSON010180 protein n=1 Tax=Culicoides sonorensis TaxID=179676 RepID=A0A336LL06_CULSO
MCRLLTFYNNNTLLCFSSALLLFLIQQQQIYIHKVNSQSTDVLIIRHGRSRVRHSTEKDHLRWGLKAFDNLTLEYEDLIDLEGSGGNGSQPDAYGFYDINGTTTSLSSLLYGNTSFNNISYSINGTNLYSNSFLISQQRERDSIGPAQNLPVIKSSIKSNNKKTSNAKYTTQKFSSNNNFSNNKLVQKVVKKKIMENIKKDVDKGLEYLRTHSDVLDATVSLIDMKIKRSESIIKFQQQQQQFTSSTISTTKATNEAFQPTSHISTNYNNVQPIAKSDMVLRQIISEQQSIFSKLKPNSNNKLLESDKLKKTTVTPINNKNDNNFLVNNKETINAMNFISSTFPASPETVTVKQDKSSYETSQNEKTIPIITKDIESESEGNLDELTFIMNDMEDLDSSSSAYQMEEIDLEDLDEVSRENRKNLIKGRDVVTTFLRIVESQHLLGANCTAGTALNLGEGVVDRYAQDRFRVEAEIAVNRANMLTRLFKITPLPVQESEHLLHASVLSMVDFDDNIFAAGHCFDWNEHPYYKGLFCPFGYRLPPPDQGTVLVKNLAADYPYLGNTSEWFFHARKNAEKVIEKNEQYTKAYHLYANSTSRISDEILTVKYENGLWSKPYYDCGGGNIWMLTYTVPFFGYENGTYHFKGTAGIDIDLRRVDIDQCPQKLPPPGTTLPLNIFAGTDKCKQRTTECTAVKGLGFRRGSYRCFCKKGFYYPDTTTDQKYFNGSTLEEEYEKYMLGEVSTYDDDASYECLPCTEGCDSCVDASPCVAELNWPMRTSILVLACVVIGFLPPAAYFTFKYQQVKVVRAASPALLRVIALGAFFIYCTSIVMYPPPSIYTCTARVWLREIGFSLTYGALMLKTWRISVIFRIRSAKTVIITDASLLKRLALLCGFVGVALLVRTLVAPPIVIVGRTADNLKAFLCKTDYWDHTFTSSKLFLQSPANPDLLYIIFFCHTQLTVSLLLALIFGSKVYLVFRGGEKGHDEPMVGIKASHTKFIHRSQMNKYGNSTTSTAQLGGTDKLTDQEALEEVKALHNQLQILLQRTPHNGAAISTISMLLEAFKQPRSNQLTVASAGLAIQSSAQIKTSNESLIAIKNKAIASTPANNTTKSTVDKCVSTECHMNQITCNDSAKICSNTIISSNYRGTDDSSNHKNCSDIVEKKEQNKGETNSTPPNNNNNCSMSVEDEINRSNVSFDDLDLRCMCSDEEEDCHHCSDTSEIESTLVKQFSDLNLESKAKNEYSVSNNKKTYESCDNLYNSKKSSSSSFNRHHHRDDSMKQVVLYDEANQKRDSKNYYHLGYNPHHKHYRKNQLETYECKLDSEIVTKKLLKSIQSNEESMNKTDEPPPVPPRKFLPNNNNQQTIGSATSKNVNILSVSNLTSIPPTLRTEQQQHLCNTHSVDPNLNSESTTTISNVKEDSGNNSTTSTENTTAGDFENGSKQSSGSVKSQKRKKSPEKRLVLDLNDRSKYTEEVSV